jgi:hypothetical protein
LGGFHDAGFNGVKQSVEVCQVSLVEAAEDLLEYLFAGGGAGCERWRAGGGERDHFGPAVVADECSFHRKSGRR